jgi:hypothetical protein
VSSSGFGAETIWKLLLLGRLGTVDLLVASGGSSESEMCMMGPRKAEVRNTMIPLYSLLFKLLIEYFNFISAAVPNSAWFC